MTIQIIDDTLISLPLASPMAGRLFAAVVVFAVTPEKRTSRASGARELVKWTPDDMHIAETPMLRQRGGELQKISIYVGVAAKSGPAASLLFPFVPNECG